MAVLSKLCGFLAGVQDIVCGKRNRDIVAVQPALDAPPTNDTDEGAQRPTTVEEGTPHTDRKSDKAIPAIELTHSFTPVAKRVRMHGPAGPTTHRSDRHTPSRLQNTFVLPTRVPSNTRSTYALTLAATTYTLPTSPAPSPSIPRSFRSQSAQVTPNTSHFYTPASLSPLMMLTPPKNSMAYLKMYDSPGRSTSSRSTSMKTPSSSMRSRMRTSHIKFMFRPESLSQTNLLRRNADAKFSSPYSVGRWPMSDDNDDDARRQTDLEPEVVERRAKKVEPAELLPKAAEFQSELESAIDRRGQFEAEKKRMESERLWQVTIQKAQACRVADRTALLIQSEKDESVVEEASVPATQVVRNDVIELPDSDEDFQHTQRDSASDEEHEPELKEEPESWELREGERKLYEDGLKIACQKQNAVLKFHESTNLDFTGADMHTLAPQQWLSDGVMNFYIALLQDRCLGEQARFPKCWLCNTFFLNKLLLDEGYKYNGVRRWTAETRFVKRGLLNSADVVQSSPHTIFDFVDKVIVPCHLGNHWTCACVNLRDKRLEYYDSLGGHRSDILDALARWLQDEHKNKNAACELDVSTWERVSNPCDTPQQKNGYDCGIFTLKCADYLAQDREFDYDQEVVREYFRPKCAVSCMEGELK